MSKCTSFPILIKKCFIYYVTVVQGRSRVKVYNYQSTQPFFVHYAFYSDMFRLNRVIIRLS